MNILGVESSCDETAASIVQDGARVLSSIVSSQHDLHEEYAGVVPELASRAHVERILPVIREALAEAGVGLGMIVLVPSLWWLYRLVLQGTLDTEYEPLDQRFKP